MSSNPFAGDGFIPSRLPQPETRLTPAAWLRRFGFADARQKDAERIVRDGLAAVFPEEMIAGNRRFWDMNDPRHDLAARMMLFAQGLLPVRDRSTIDAKPRRRRSKIEVRGRTQADAAA